MKTYLMISSVIILFLGVFFDVLIFFTTPLIPPAQPLEYTLKPGSSISKFAYDLHAQGILSRPLYLITYAKLKRISHKLQAGEYRFPAGATPNEVLQQMVEGKLILHAIAFIEGWTFQQMLEALNHEPHLLHTLNSTDEGTLQKIMADIGHPEEHPEGRFFPDTYLFHTGTRDTAVLKAAYQKMEEHLSTLWAKRDMAIPYHAPYEALIVASMVEKEAKQASERTKIAGVIIHRWQIGMPLQIDAAVIYGLGDDYHGKLDHDNVHTIDTAYNTYLHKGLPPTPIAMPGLASLTAAFHPEITSALYYVAKGDGSHTFSDTFADHQEAVQEYKEQKDRWARACGPLPTLHDLISGNANQNNVGWAKRAQQACPPIDMPSLTAPLFEKGGLGEISHNISPGVRVPYAQ